MLKIEKNGNQYTVQLFQVNKLNTLFSDLVGDQLRVLAQESGSEILFNLEGIRFIDSSGFRVLIEISELAKKSGSRFKLCNLTEDVKELLNLLSLQGRFESGTIVSSRERILAELD